MCLIDSRPRDLTLGERAELQALADEVVALIAAREFPSPSALSAR